MNVNVYTSICNIQIWDHVSCRVLPVQISNKRSFPDYMPIHNQLKNTFEQITPLDEPEWEHIQNRFKPEKIPAKRLITSLGETETKIYFVLKGILRLYCYNPKGEEVTIFLFRENYFASSYHSFLTQTPGNQALEALEETTLLSISKPAMDELHRLVPKMNLITRVIADQRFINSQRIFTSQITYTPQERYVQFEKNHGDLLLRVPHHIIASFLGITPVSMSRIRKRLTKQRAVS
jgi:CRP-like cAMP-binding protein